MKIKFLPSFLIPLTICFSCSPKCDMENSSKWQTVKKGADVNKQVTALTELIVAADADIGKVTTAVANGKANGKLDLKWDLDKTIKKSKYKETVWDLEVWHEIQIATRVYCTTRSEIAAGIYKTEAQYNKALEQLDQAKNYLISAQAKAKETTVTTEKD
jgi:hypothetical protein